MSVTMIRVKVKRESVTEVEEAARTMFATIDAAEPKGVSYASTELPDGVTFVAFLALDGEDDPLAAIPEFWQFQQRLPGWLDGAPTPEPLTVVGSYNLF
jgi:hypothetical protein